MKTRGEEKFFHWLDQVRSSMSVASIATALDISSRQLFRIIGSRKYTQPSIAARKTMQGVTKNFVRLDDWKKKL